MKVEHSRTSWLSPGQLFTLWDMTKILPSEFTTVGRQLDSAIEFCGPVDSLAHQMPRTTETANQEQQQDLLTLLTNLYNVCSDLHLKESLFLVKEARQWLADPAAYMVRDPDKPGGYKVPKTIPQAKFDEVHRQLLTIRKRLHAEMGLIVFALIPPDKAQFAEQPALFGEAVTMAFPSAANEIKQAGNCLATDLNTAAVFHLMRTTEIAVRALAKHLETTFDGDLKYADCGKLARAINTRLEQLRQEPRGEARTAELEFYGEVLAEFNSLKDLWRTPLVHTMKNANALEASIVLMHVRCLMSRLAAKISE